MSHHSQRYTIWGNAKSTDPGLSLMGCCIMRRLPHRRLLHKLDYFGIRGSTHKWINSWLSGRSQQVVLDGQDSDPVPVLSGVPQGSVLGPILFLVFL